MNAPPAEATSAVEIAAGKRFEFGRNWAAFIESLDEQRIASACSSLAGDAGRSGFEG